MPESTGVVLRDIAKSFLAHPALRLVSTEFKLGEVALLLGANGSGKSTLLGILAGLVRPDSGILTLQLSSRRGSVGYFGHQHLLYAELTVRENLQFAAKLLGVVDYEELARWWGLAPHMDRPLSALSKGWQSKVALCRAGISNPDLLLLDEPSASLDEAGLGLLCAQIEERRRAGAGVIIATHDVTRLCSYAQRVVVLHQGSIAADEYLGPGGLSNSAIEFYRKVNR